jgi:hypothetical protein
LFSFSFNNWYFWISFFMYYVYCIFWVEVICPIYHILFLYYTNYPIW